MTNEKRLIDANDAKREIWNTDCDVFEFCDGCVTKMGITRVELDDAIDRVPTVDAVEVVRCKDCIYYHKELGYGFGQCSKCNLMPYPDDFCSYGERREGE